MLATHTPTHALPYYPPPTHTHVQHKENSWGIQSPPTFSPFCTPPLDSFAHGQHPEGTRQLSSGAQRKMEWRATGWRPTIHFADSGCAACAERQRERNGQRECVGAWGLVFVCVGERWGAPFFSALSCDKSKTRQGGGVQGGRQQEGERNILLPCLGAFDMAVVYVNWILLIYTTLYIPVQSRTWCYSFGVSRLQILHSVLSHAQLVSKTGLMASRGGSS